MQSKQFVGPITGSTSVNLNQGYQILQIGVEHPCSTPIQQYIDIEEQETELTEEYDEE
jgi:hypothetical protein